MHAETSTAMVELQSKYARSFPYYFHLRKIKHNTKILYKMKSPLPISSFYFSLRAVQVIYSLRFSLSIHAQYFRNGASAPPPRGRLLVADRSFLDAAAVQRRARAPAATRAPPCRWPELPLRGYRAMPGTRSRRRDTLIHPIVTSPSSLLLSPLAPVDGVLGATQILL
jgi:hypothetical protein